MKLKITTTSRKNIGCHVGKMEMDSFLLFSMTSWNNILILKNSLHAGRGGNMRKYALVDFLVACLDVARNVWTGSLRPGRFCHRLALRLALQRFSARQISAT